MHRTITRKVNPVFLTGFSAVTLLCISYAIGKHGDFTAFSKASDRFHVLFSSEVNSITGHTGPGVVPAFQSLLKSLAPVNETSETTHGAADAVAALEGLCGWDPVTSDFLNPTCLKDVPFNHTEQYDTLPVRPDLLDIVVPSIRHLDFLEEWREFIEPYHIIIIQDGDPDVQLAIPTWVNYELYNRRDIVQALGGRAWIISSKDASIRNMGFLVSKKRYIFTLDDDCLPAYNATGHKINAVGAHLRNLLTNATPHFFNTLSDPYAPGTDFVRGYPYSMRHGVPTVISHGLWLNAPDYDAPTQLLKVHERNMNHHEVTQTIPKGVLYPMCSMNVAFDRERIGPAFMQGLMGEGQPWARYDDMFAGWTSKLVADHLGYGVKNGAPYIWHNKASNPFANLRKEYMGLEWQETIIHVFRRTQLGSCTTAASCYHQLAEVVLKEFAHLNPYFPRLAMAMRYWVDAWEAAEKGVLQFTPSRWSPGHVVLNATPLSQGILAFDACLTYRQRYSRCNMLKSKPVSERQRIFYAQNRSPTATEAALLRVTDKPWSDDMWLNACTFVLEAASVHRHVVLYTIQGGVPYVPEEFKPLVHTHDDDDLRRFYTQPIYLSGYYHGDMAAAWWAKYHPRYNYIWVTESDVRFTGNWDDLFTSSRRYARTAYGMLVATPPDQEDDLVTFSMKPGIVNAQMDWWWSEPKYMHGFWTTNFTTPTLGSALMSHGFSKRLAQAVFDMAVKGDSSDNQECNLPAVALAHQMKMVYVPVTDKIKYDTALDGASTSIYTAWRDQGHCLYAHLLHPIKL